MAVGTYLDIICEVFNSQGIPRLIDINGDKFNGITDYPKMQHTDIEKPDLAQLSAFIKDMVGVGVFVPDDELEDYVRRAASLPERVATEDNNRPDINGKEEMNSTYKVTSLLAKYKKGELSRAVITDLLTKIRVDPEKIESYLDDIDREKALEQQKHDAADELEAAKAKQALGR